MSSFRLAELGEFLDPRPAEIFAQTPISRAANIPLAELESRLHELPPKDEAIRVANTGPEALSAVEFLRRGGRSADLTDEFKFLKNSSPPYRLWNPNAFLMTLLPELQKGSALDLGCGSGRESVALAGNGFAVVAADILSDALDKGRDLARRYLIGQPNETPPIEWLRRDIEKEGPHEGAFDLIVSFRYLHRPLLATIEKLLNPGGSLVLETFTELHRERHGKPSSDHHVLRIGELSTLAPGLEIKIAEEGWRGDSHTGRLWAQKL